MENNERLFNEIKTNLYDIQSSVEVVKNEFKKNNIEVDEFLSTIDYYIANIDRLKKFKDEILLNLLIKKLQFIRNKYQYSNSYSSEFKANINFIIKHQDTFFGTILKLKRINYNTNSHYLNAIKKKGDRNTRSTSLPQSRQHPIFLVATSICHCS